MQFYRQEWERSILLGTLPVTVSHIIAFHAQKNQCKLEDRGTDPVHHRGPDCARPNPTIGRPVFGDDQHENCQAAR